MAVLQRFDKRLNSRWGRVLRENLVAYLFLAPALLLIFVFGIYPVGFAFFVSLYQWRRFPDQYNGLAHYVRALDNFAYVLFFWIALGLVIYALLMLRRLWRQRELRLPALSSVLPGAVNATAILLLINWLSILIPIIINIPQRLRGQARVPGLFIDELFASFRYPEAVAVVTPLLIVGIIAIAVSVFWLRVIRFPKLMVVAAPESVEESAEIKQPQPSQFLLRGTTIVLAAAVGGLLLQLTVSQISAAAAAAQVATSSLPVWSQLIFISAGVALLVGAYLLWQRAFKQSNSNRRLIIFALGAALLVVGGYALAVELPRALVNADPNVLNGFNITVMFALGTVPFQLSIGLGLAYLLFQNIKGKAFFRIVYFLPYIMPFVATSIVFGLIFSTRPTSLANHMLEFFGIAPQKWLLEPTGVISLIFNGNVPPVLTGPSLALVVIMMYTTWTYIGYDAAVFLAGLGGIPPELYEAARIDGAGGWSIFRHITLPLLSPTTFFLSLIAVIGTFQAFTQIWIMRTPASQRAVDTLGVHIFETVRSADPNMGYGSAMAFVLFAVILLLTVFQNRIMGSRVFYG